MSSKTTFLKPVLAVLLIAVLVSSASAKTNSMQVAQPGVLEITPLEKAPSLTVPQPLQTEVLGRHPFVDMGFHPLNVDAARQSLIWNAFPQPPQIEILERRPLIDMGIFPQDDAQKNPSEAVRQPQQADPIRKTPSLHVPQPMQIEPADKAPSTAVKQPMQAEILERRPLIDMGIFPQDDAQKNPSEAVRQPQQADPIRKNPSEAVRQPQQADPIRKTPSLEVAQPMDDESVRKTPSLEVAQPMDDESVRKTPSLEIAQPMQVDCAGPTLQLDLKHAANVEVVIYSVTGRVVKSMLNQALPAGLHELTWDGRDNNGARAASGVYFARVLAGDQAGKGKLVLVR